MAKLKLCKTCGKRRHKSVFDECWDCYVKRTRVRFEADEPTFDDAYDGLKLCSVCGDRETQDEICWSCQQQAWIDKYG